MLEVGGMVGGRDRVHFIVPELAARLPSTLPTAKLLSYSPKALARIRRVIAGRPAYSYILITLETSNYNYSTLLTILFAVNMAESDWCEFLCPIKTPLDEIRRQAQGRKKGKLQLLDHRRSGITLIDGYQPKPHRNSSAETLSNRPSNCPPKSKLLVMAPVSSHIKQLHTILKV